MLNLFQQQLQDSHTIAEVRLTELDNMRGGLERALLDIQTQQTSLEIWAWKNPENQNLM